MIFEQDRFLVRLQQRVAGEHAIAVCFLSGSYGRRLEDDFSDMDVALVFRDDLSREMAWQRRQAFVRDITTFVPAKSFDATHIRPFFHIALYSTGTKVDYRYETKAALQPNPWDRDIRILKDDHGWAEAFQAASAQQPLIQPRLTANQLTEIDSRLWVMFWDVFRLLLRGEHDKPFPIYLQLLQFTLPPLLNVLPPGPARAGLLNAQFSANTPLTRQHMAQLLEAYLTARQAIIQQFHLDFSPDTRFETAVRQLVIRHANNGR